MGKNKLDELTDEVLQLTISIEKMIDEDEARGDMRILAMALARTQRVLWTLRQEQHNRNVRKAQPALKTAMTGLEQILPEGV